LKGVKINDEKLDKEKISSIIPSMGYFTQ